MINEMIAANVKATSNSSSVKPDSLEQVMRLFVDEDLALVERIRKFCSLPKGPEDEDIYLEQLSSWDETLIIGVFQIKTSILFCWTDGEGE